jgi:hypothetical protein
MTALRMAQGGNSPVVPTVYDNNTIASRNPASSYQTATPQQLQAAGITPIIINERSNTSRYATSASISGGRSPLSSYATSASVGANVGGGGGGYHSQHAMQQQQHQHQHQHQHQQSSTLYGSLSGVAASDDYKMQQNRAYGSNSYSNGSTPTNAGQHPVSGGGSTTGPGGMGITTTGGLYSSNSGGGSNKGVGSSSNGSVGGSNGLSAYHQQILATKPTTSNDVSLCKTQLVVFAET